MTESLDAFLNVILLVGGLAGVGAIFDQIVVDKHKHAVSWYVFGFADARLSSFETACIRGLLSPFIVQNRLMPFRVFFYSFVVTVVFAIASQDMDFFDIDWILPRYDFKLTSDVIEMMLTAFVVAIYTAFLDFLSFRVTKFFFWDKSPKFPASTLLILADMFLSMLPYLLWAAIAYLVVTLTGIHPFNSGYHEFVLTVFVGIVSAILISIVQILLLWVGVFSRGLIRLTRLNNWLALSTHLPDHPFIFLSIMLALMFSGLQLVYG